MSEAVKSVDDHLAEILAAVTPLPPRETPLLEAVGAVLAEPVRAPIDLPPFDNSAMDGYAVRAADLAAASESSPVTLPVLGDIAAGAPAGAPAGAGARPDRIGPGQCARIMTGAPLPAGADAVVPVEWTDGGATEVRISRPAEPGRYVRPRGEDITAGQVVLEPGTPLGAAQVGLCAAVGRGRVAVRPRPRVAVLSTGSELVEPGRPIETGEIWDANSFTLAAAATEAGFTAERHGIVADDADTVLSTLQGLVARVDAIVTSGGVSMGVYDVVKEVLRRLGTVRFGKVAMRPGKPQGFGMLEAHGARVPIFTLPGNPVSAYVSFQVFVKPALRVMQGLPAEPPAAERAVTATLTAPVRSPAGLRHYLRGRLVPRPAGATAGAVEAGDAAAAAGPAAGGPAAGGAATSGGALDAVPAEGQGSHQLASLAGADGLIVIPENVTELPAGAPVDVLPLPGR